MRDITGCLRIAPTSFLPILSGITPHETRRCASCLKLYTRAFNPKHLLDAILNLRPPRKRLRALLELQSTIGKPTTSTPQPSNHAFPHLGHNHQVATFPVQPPADWRCWIFGQDEIATMRFQDFFTSAYEAICCWSKHYTKKTAMQNQWFNWNNKK